MGKEKALAILLELGVILGKTILDLSYVFRHKAKSVKMPFSKAHRRKPKAQKLNAILPTNLKIYRKVLDWKL